MSRRPSFSLGLSLALVLVSPITARAVTLRVPQEYPTIAGAADVAQRGDSILVWRDGDRQYAYEVINLRQGVVM